MKKNMREESLGTRLKSYEKKFEIRIPATDYIIVRCDGHKFSKFTKGFKKPFDNILRKTMLQTTLDLVDKFGAATGYEQSDEITLIFPPQFKETLKPIEWKDIVSSESMCQLEELPEYKVFNREDVFIGYVEACYEPDEEGYGVTEYYISDIDNKILDHCSLQSKNKKTLVKTENMFKKYIIKEVVIKNEQIFGGRIQKMSSLIASYTTMRFNTNLQNALDDDIYGEYGNGTDEERAYWDKIKKKVGTAWFDARVFGVPNKEEAFNCLMWRIRDSEKNSRSMFAQTYCSHKSLLNKNGEEQVNFCLEKTGNDWNKIKDEYKFGMIVKKEAYEKIVNLDHIQTFSDVDTVTRTRLVSWSEDITSFSDEKVDLIGEN